MGRTGKKLCQIAGVLILACTIIALPAFTKNVSAEGGIPIDSSTFPDSAFRAFVEQFFDVDQDQMLSAEEIEAATFLELQGRDVSNLTGIEHLTSLAFLILKDTSITTLDLRNNVNLETLSCERNLQLENIDISQNTKLKVLMCSVNCGEIEGWQETDGWIYGKLKTLDVSNCPELESLNCFSNSLTKLDVTNNPNLKELVCDANPDLRRIDVRKNPELIRLSCINTGITKLDVSKNLKLERLECNGLQGLSTLNLFNNAALKELFCWGLKQEVLDLTQNPELTDLRCNSGNLSMIRLHPDTYGKLKLKKTDLNGAAKLSKLKNITEKSGILTVKDKNVPATYQYTSSGETRPFTIVYTNEPSDPADSVSKAKHFFYDYTHETPVYGTPVLLDGAKKDSLTLYTDILPSYHYTETNGTVQAEMGKVIAGVTMSKTKPTLKNGKIDDSKADQIVRVKIKNGQITVTATGKVEGTVYLWVMDTGGNGAWEGTPINVKLKNSSKNKK